MKEGLVKASGNVNKNLFSWNNRGATEITLNNYQNTGSFTQFNNCLTFDPSTKIGTKYTISLWARSVNGTTKLQLYNANSTPRYFYFSTVLTESLGADWQYFTYTFTNQDRGSGNILNRIEIYMPSQMGGQVKEIKIEQGEVATPWVPASTDSSYTGDTCGFTELGGNICKIGEECISATNFIEW
jgi:hypothetical protein